MVATETSVSAIDIVSSVSSTSCSGSTRAGGGGKIGAFFKVKFTRSIPIVGSGSEFPKPMSTSSSEELQTVHRKHFNTVRRDMYVDEQNKINISVKSNPVLIWKFVIRFNVSHLRTIKHTTD